MVDLGEKGDEMFMADKKMGKVTHYYDHIGVAVVELKVKLSVGDKIKFSGHGVEFSQEVSSIQIEHANVQSAKKGQIVGLKVDKKVKDGAEVFKA